MGEADGTSEGPPLAVTGGVQSLFTSLTSVFTQAQREVQVAMTIFSSTAASHGDPFGHPGAEVTYRQHVDATRAALRNLTDGLGEIASAIRGAGVELSAIEREVAQSMAVSTGGG